MSTFLSTERIPAAFANPLHRPEIRALVAFLEFWIEMNRLNESGMVDLSNDEMR